MRQNRFLYAMVAVLLFWSLLPIYWFLRLAFMQHDEISAFPPDLIPHSPNLASFFNVFGFDYRLADGQVVPASGQANQVIHGLINSIIVSLTETVLTLAIVVPLSYTFARLEFRFRNALFNCILLAVAIPPISTLIPFYTLYVKLNLAGTLTGLVIVDLTVTVPFVAWMLVGYMRNLPPIEKLAKVDGFGRLQTLVFIILPLARSGIAVAAVIAFLFAWNEFTFALVLVNATPANTLPTAISGFLFQAPEPANLAACIMLAICPPALVAYFLQRHVGEMGLADPLR